MVGDAVGLPYEGLAPARARKLLKGPVRPRLIFGRAMVSDDGEHALMTAEALLSNGDLEKELARRLRRWFLLFPAGMGIATAKACIKLLLRLPSGVPSAGNGAAMRAAAVGAYYADDPAAREAAIVKVARLTHTDERAVTGARLIALAAACAARGEEAAFPNLAQEIAPDWPLDFSSEKGPSGYVLQSVPAALGVWLRHPRDFRAAVTEAIELGGDADTVAAMVGGIVGIVDSPPQEWVDALWEPVRGPAYLSRLAEGERPRAPGLLQLPRNLLFLLIVLTHGFRRLVP
jgi:ADP-ribosyl-[dinitrogen reductase] hydrolase